MCGLVSLSTPKLCTLAAALAWSSLPRCLNDVPQQVSACSSFAFVRAATPRRLTPLAVAHIASPATHSQDGHPDGHVTQWLQDR
jgi:hypothetical protein